MATALYHTAAAPNLFADVDGRYRGMDSAVHTLPTGEANYSTYSLWDTYRALHPLLSLIDAPRNAAFARNLARMTLESPFGPPVWPLQGIETHCMIAWHSVAVMAEALNKGASGLDLATLWPALRHLAFERKDSGLEPYRRLGYIPADTVREAASKTLEYAYDDWAMAKIAEAAARRRMPGAARGRATGATCLTRIPALCARAWPMAPGPRRSIRARWATIPTTGAILPNATPGRRRSWPSTIRKA
jgi:putative alpha-1,2-mannosidase